MKDQKGTGPQKTKKNLEKKKICLTYLLKGLNNIQSLVNNCNTIKKSEV